MCIGFFFERKSQSSTTSKRPWKLRWIANRHKQSFRKHPEELVSRLGAERFISKNDVCNDLTNGKTTPKIEVLSICQSDVFWRQETRGENSRSHVFFSWNLLFLPCRWMGLLTLVTTKSMMRWCLLIVPDCWTFPTGSVFLSGIWWFRFLQLDFFFARAVCAWKLLFEQQRVLEFLRSISLRDFEITCVMWLGYQLGSKTDPFWCVHNFGIF